MAQWINNEHSSEQQFCKSEISTFDIIAQSGLMAGWVAGIQNTGKFHLFKIQYRSNFLTFAVFNTVTTLLEQYECV